jgi:hypothetical protein
MTTKRSSVSLPAKFAEAILLITQAREILDDNLVRVRAPRDVVKAIHDLNQIVKACSKAIDDYNDERDRQIKQRL